MHAARGFLPGICEVKGLAGVGRDGREKGPCIMCAGRKWDILHPHPVPHGHLRVLKRRSDIPRAPDQAAGG